MDFKSLPQQKQDQIMHACIREFAHYGFLQSSTNRIVKEAGIAKGSLFKYFGSKEDLYIYVLKHVAQELFREINLELGSLPKDLVQRIVHFATVEMEVHIKNPVHFKLFHRAMENDGSSISQRVQEEFGVAAQGYAQGLLEGIDTSILRGSKEEVVQLILWFLKGFNQEFIEKVSHDVDLKEVMNQYMRELNKFLGLLTNGIYRD